MSPWACIWLTRRFTVCVPQNGSLQLLLPKLLHQKLEPVISAGLRAQRGRVAAHPGGSPLSCVGKGEIGGLR